MSLIIFGRCSDPARDDVEALAIQYALDVDESFSCRYPHTANQFYRDRWLQYLVAAIVSRLPDDTGKGSKCKWQIRYTAGCKIAPLGSRILLVICRAR